MLLNPLTYHNPKTLCEASKLYAELDSVKLQAGGTFLLNSLKLMKTKGQKTPQNIIGLNNINELKGIEINHDEVIIRAMTTVDDIAKSSELLNKLPIFQNICKDLSTQPIRNMATIGGNLTCRYTWTEMPAVIIAMDANMHFIDNTNKGHILSAEEFFKAGAKTDMIFSHISIKIEEGAQFSYKRIRKSASIDIPQLSLLLKTKIVDNKFTNTRIGINNCIQFAQRDKTLEAFLDSQTINEDLPEKALKHLEDTIYDSRSNDYKKHIFRISIKNAIKEIIEQHNKK